MRTPDLRGPQPRGLVFGWVLVLLAAIDVAAVVIEQPLDSPAAVAARGVICAGAGFLASRRWADLMIAPLLVAGAAVLSLTISDVAIFLAQPLRGRGGYVNPLITHLVVPAVCAAAGAIVALAIARREAGQSAGV
jgi:hypothetical protein